MISLEQITKHFGDKAVIKDLCFSFPDTGIFAIMGPSGCGKTTLLRLLAGLEQPDGGKITSTHQKIAVCFQEPRLLSWLDCEKNVKCVLSKDMKESNAVEELLKALELDGVKKAFPDALSGGMKQRLSLARALAFGGDLLLLDEPFSALDEDLKERIAPLIRVQGQNGLVILITHDEKEAALLGATLLRCEGVPFSTLLS